LHIIPVCGTFRSALSENGSQNEYPAPEIRSGTLKERIALQEARIINETLRKTNGDADKAASELGISRATLKRKLRIRSKEESAHENN